jgi:hypothetical protein
MHLPPAGPAFNASELDRAKRLVARFALPSDVKDRVLKDIHTLQQAVLTQEGARDPR